MASGLKSGSKDSGSVAPVNKTSSVSRNETSHDVAFAKGGNNKMFGAQAAGEQKPALASSGGTAHDVSGGAPGAEFAKGGSGKMFGFAGSQPAESGKTSAR
jgi:hypothetical protein